MSRPNADYIREEPATQPFDLFGLVAGTLFALAGLAYLFGGHRALSGNSGVVLPTVIVLVGLAGVAGSGLVRRSWFSRTPQPASGPADREDAADRPADGLSEKAENTENTENTANTENTEAEE